MSDDLKDIPQELADHSDYQVLKQLGRGGMGVVYLAKYLPMDRMEVLKVLDDSLVTKESAKKRFISEMRVIGNLNHRFIATAYQRVMLPTQLVFSMEYVRGIDLHRFTSRYNPVPIHIACKLCRQIAEALQHAHSRGMVHRDIKPSNVMVFRADGELQIKVLDFGLAKAISEQSATGLTADGTMLGTPEYMAPEQALDAAAADIRADIYSLGCTLYHLAAGTPPFSGTYQSVLMAHAQKPSRSLTSLRSDVPEMLSDVVARMLAKDPSDRYQSPTDVVRALSPFTTALTPSTSKRRSSFEPEVSSKSEAPQRSFRAETEHGQSLLSHSERQLHPSRDSASFPLVETVPRKPIGAKPNWSRSVLFIIFLLTVGVFAYPKFFGASSVDQIAEDFPPDSDVRVDGGQFSREENRVDDSAAMHVEFGSHDILADSDDSMILDEKTSLSDHDTSSATLDPTGQDQGNERSQSSPEPAISDKATAKPNATSVEGLQVRSVVADLMPKLLASPDEIQGAWHERYENIPGRFISELIKSPLYPASPDTSILLDDFEAPSGFAEAYGVRIRALLRAPMTGNYVFSVAAGDITEVWMSGDATAENAKMIIHLTDTQLPQPREWNAVPGQKSEPVFLEKGSSYYIEVRMKGFYGYDYLAVAWSGPHQELPTIIGGEYLSPVGCSDLSMLYRAVPDTVATASNEPVDICVCANDRLLRSDFESGEFQLTQPKHGRTTILSKGVVRYQPKPGFAGVDSFQYSLTSNDSILAQATVKVFVNEQFAHADAREQVLANVSVLSDPNAPGEMVVYGPTAISVANYPGESIDHPMIAAATLGRGRVIAVPDAQWLLMNEHGSDASMKSFYKNALAWLSKSPSMEITIAFYKQNRGRFVEDTIRWLKSQGYRNVHAVDNASLAKTLLSADVFISDWMGGSPLPDEVVQALQNFAANGGGLFLGEYGYGYKLWWKQRTVDIPGNCVLRYAGIGFVKDAPRRGAQAATPASNHFDAEDLMNTFSGRTSTLSDTVIRNIARKTREVLPEDDLYRATLDLLSPLQESSSP